MLYVNFSQNDKNIIYKLIYIYKYIYIYNLIEPSKSPLYTLKSVLKFNFFSSFNINFPVSINSFHVFGGLLLYFFKSLSLQYKTV